MSKGHQMQRGWWDLLADNTSREALRQKARLDSNRKIISDYFEKAGGLRNHLATLAAAMETDKVHLEGMYRHVEEIHPAALSMISLFGVEYKPFLWTQPPGVEPTEASCHLNALVYMAAYNRCMKQVRKPERRVYVEGVYVGQDMVLHAWNAESTNSPSAIDVTLYATGAWSFYLGVPLEEDEYKRARAYIHSSGRYLRMFGRNEFPKVENYLTELLGKRKEQQDRAA